MATTINSTTTLTQAGDSLGMELEVRIQRLDYHQLGVWLGNESAYTQSLFFDGFAEVVMDDVRKLGQLANRLDSEDNRTVENLLAILAAATRTPEG